MNENLAHQMERLNIALDAFEVADSDKRYNAARQEVLARWNDVVNWIGDDEEVEYCECCGDPLDKMSDTDEYGELGDYCAECQYDLDNEEDY